MRIRSTVTMLAAAGLLAACGADDDPQEQDAAPEDGVDDLEDPEGDLDDTPDELEDMEDPNELISDGVFRGQGVFLPVPDDFTLDEQSFAMGQVVATTGFDAEDPEGGDPEQVLVATAQDVSEAPEEEDLTLDGIIDNMLAQGQLEPSDQEDVDLENADEARALFFDEIEGQPGPDGEEPAAQQGMVVVALDGADELAQFEYVAQQEFYDESIEEQLLGGAGFDPDSDPLPPQPMEQPEMDGEMDEEMLEELEEELEDMDQ